MMKDNLEDFISKNKSGFDSHEPSPELWMKIDQELSKNKPQEKVVPLKLVIRIAASILLLISIGIGFLVINPTKEMVVNNKVELKVSLKDISPEMADVENYYSSQIEDKMNVLRSMEGNEEILEEMKQLDADYSDLQSEIKGGVNQEKLIEAMVDHYKLKLEILENILGQIEEQKLNKTSKDEIQKINI